MKAFVQYELFGKFREHIKTFENQSHFDSWYDYISANGKVRGVKSRNN
jgi:hypothetical protein